MADILEGTVLDVLDGEMLELEVDHVQSADRHQYGAHELVRVAAGWLADGAETDDDEATALMTLLYHHRRVRCYVEERDQFGRIVGDVEVVPPPEPDERFGFADDES